MSERKNLLGFGFMRLPLTNNEDPTSVDFKQVCKMVDLFMNHGYNYFDTAYPYHFGVSEKAINECVVKRYPREDIKIANKLPLFNIKSNDDIERIFNEQLKRCGVEYFDYYLLHNLSQWTRNAWENLNSFEFVSKMKEEGKIKQIGFSYHDNAELLDKVLTKHPEMDIVQLQINYIDWENSAIQSKENYEVTRKHEKPIIVMEPFKGGTIMNLPNEAKKLMNEINPNESFASWALRYFADMEGVVKVLTGASNFKQIKENIEIMDNITPLNENEKEVLNKAVEIVNDTQSIPCTKCNYCLGECSVNIPIPTYFELYNNEKQFGHQQFSAQQAFYRTYALKEDVGMASDCTQCESCVARCPQHLDIPKYLEDVYEEFEKSMNEF